MRTLPGARDIKTALHAHECILGNAKGLSSLIGISGDSAARQAVSNHLTTDNGGKIDKAARHGDAGDVHSPDLVGAQDRPLEPGGRRRSASPG